MYLKVNKKELNHITDVIDKENSDLHTEIYQCIKDVEKLDIAFDTPEMKSVIEDFALYLEKLKLIPIFFEDINMLMKKAGNIYYETDNSFKRELEKESTEKYESKDEC